MNRENGEIVLIKSKFNLLAFPMKKFFIFLLFMFTVNGYETKLFHQLNFRNFFAVVFVVICKFKLFRRSEFLKTTLRTKSFSVGRKVNAVLQCIKRF